MTNSGIYAFLNLINGKFYIGSASNFYKRYHVHKSLLVNNKHDNSYLQRAWNKYGQINFIFVILEYVTDVSKLTEIEQRWLDTTKCYEREIGYNSRRLANSNLGVIFTQDTKDKIRAAKLGTVVSDETRRKLSASRIGRIFTVETRAKLSLAKQNQTEETRRKNSEAQKKRVASPETKARLRNAWNIRRSRDYPHL